MITRRNFIAQAGTVAGAAILLNNDLLLAAGIADKPGLQLYTLRNELPKDVKLVISKIAQAGYGFVETYGYDKNNSYWGLDASTLRLVLKDNGLRSVSGHYNLNSFFINGATSDLKMSIASAHALGQEYLLVPSLPGELIKTVDECKKMAEKLNDVAQLCRAEGLKTGYHNHNFEWRPIADTTFYDVLLNYTDPALVHMELDLFWVVRANQDPITLLRQHPGRFKFVHIKDRDKEHSNLNTEIGKGSIDFKRIIPAAQKAGVKYMIVEQENFNQIDPFDSISQSAAYLKKVLHIG